MKASDPPIIVRYFFPVPVHRAWKAITVLQEMRQWFFDNIPAFEARVGFETMFTVTSEDRVFPHRWQIIEVSAPHRITYDWRYDGYKGRATVTFELTEREGGTEITLTNTVNEDFPDGIPEFRAESCRGGWEYFLQQRLANYL